MMNPYIISATSEVPGGSDDEKSLDKRKNYYQLVSILIDKELSELWEGLQSDKYNPVLLNAVTSFSHMMNVNTVFTAHDRRELRRHHKALFEFHTSVTSLVHFNQHLQQLWDDYRLQKTKLDFVEFWTSVGDAKNCMDNLHNFTDEERSTLRSVHHRLFDMYLKTKRVLDYERTQKK